MNKYQQLENILNKCIKKWWKPFNLLPKEVWIIQCISDWIVMELNTNWMNVDWSYHDLFSKDSGIMEFVEWKATMSFGYWNIKVRYNEMSTMTADEKIDYFISNVII